MYILEKIKSDFTQCFTRANPIKKGSILIALIIGEQKIFVRYVILASPYFAHKKPKAKRLSLMVGTIQSQSLWTFVLIAKSMNIYLWNLTL